MRAQPAPSEARRPAAQLVAYGGSRAWSMREDAQPGAERLIPGTRHARRQPQPCTGRARRSLRKSYRRQGTLHPWRYRPVPAGRKSTTREPMIQEANAFEPEATRREAGVTESSRANRGWWDRNADEYQIEHGTFLGDDRFVWGPEGLDEAEAGLLGPAGGLKGKDVLEIGAGAAQCSRWLAAQGARPVALDLSHRQLQHALRIGGRPSPWYRPTPGRCPSRTAPSTWRARRTGRCPSSPTRCGCCGRCAGCCGPAAASSSRSPTRSAGPSRTSRAPRG